MTVYYPRRTDGVVAIAFDDSQSVENIYDALGGPEITITVQPRMGDIMVVGGYRVEQGRVVVIEVETRTILEVMDSWDFKRKYSKDGL
ncbi:hypothetical protein [Mycobacteroides abscessus]|uniref:hypothetical protein n=1 Tax=Mycobacteroides abscessus TaxID=36809 RepID=UPI000C25E825|nr:hypothetical protein [Mycobacteroides abscessus]